jgi:Alanyl-tRNA synthetase
MFENKKRFSLKMDLQTFADDPNPNQDPNPTPDPNKDKTFTQAELDAAVTSRLSRAEKAAKTALAKELGYDSVEAMQAALKKPEEKKKDEDKKTDPVDVDKIVEAKLKEQNDKTFKRLLASEVKVVANELGFVDWEEAMAFADLTGAKEDEKGNIVAKVDDEGKVTTVKEVLEELLKKKPHLGKQKTGNGAFGAQIGGGSGGGDDKARREALIKEAQGRGVIPQNQTVHNPWS